MQDETPWRDVGRDADERVELLLAAMTLEEKVAQLGSVWLQPPADSAEIDGGAAPMQELFTAAAVDFDRAAEGGLGQITRAYGTAPVTVEEGSSVLRDLQRRVIAANRFGLPAIAHEETLTGLAAWGATAFPTPLAWAAAFDPDAVERMAALIAADLRALGVHQALAPVLDVVRDHRWGRVEETMGEDPLVIGTLGAAYVRGLEGGGVVSTLKHFAGYSASRGGRNHAPVSIGPRELAQVVLPPFEQALVEGGARSVMNSYTDVDGVPAAVDRRLLTGLLRDEWGFTGTVVSDYWSIPFVASMHRVAADDRAAGDAALAAGMDVELPETVGFAGLPDAVRAGRVDEALVDRSVRRVLRQKVDAGLLDGGDPVPADAGDHLLDGPEHREVAATIARRSLVLLTNDGVLPLAAAVRRIALIGPSASSRECLLGCYSFPNHVLRRMGIDDPRMPIDTVEEALRRELPDADLVVERGVDFRDPDERGIASAVAAARAAELAVVVVGDLSGLFGRGTSGEGCDAPDLSLPGAQQALVDAVLATGVPTVLVVVSGRPYALGSAVTGARAILQAFLPGVEGAGAIAGALSGRLEPGGRLPVQIPASPSTSAGGYLQPPLGRHAEGVTALDPTPAFPFGHGLGWSRPDLGDVTGSAAEIPTDGTVDVAVTLASGDAATDEVVQLYVEHETAEVALPERRLIGFARVAQAPGGRAEVVFSVPTDVVSYVGVDRDRAVRPGRIRLVVGRSVTDVVGSVAVDVTGPVRPVGHRRAFGASVTVREEPA